MNINNKNALNIKQLQFHNAVYIVEATSFNTFMMFIFIKQATFIVFKHSTYSYTSKYNFRVIYKNNYLEKKLPRN